MKEINHIEPKGWFYPSGLFVILDWSIQQEEKEYLSYLAAFGHEQFHYLQHIGTTFGVFLADLEDMWTTDVIHSIQFAIKETGSLIFPLRDWIKYEKNNLVKRRLMNTLQFYLHYNRVSEISLSGGPISAMHEFTELYKDLLNLQYNDPNPIWYVDIDDLPVDFTGDFQSPGYLGGSLVMECATMFRQQSIAADLSSYSDELKTFPEGTRRGILNAPGKKEAKIRAEASFYSDYSIADRLIGGYLPNDPTEALNVLYIILDLSLMPPIGRFNSIASVRPSCVDLLPGLRLFRAAEAVQRLGITALDIGSDYESVVDAICVDLCWPQPEWLAMQSQRLSEYNSNYQNNVLHDLQIRASKYRKKNNGAFAFPRSPLIDEFRIPTVFYLNGQKGGIPNEMGYSLVARFIKRLCAETWISGKKPDFPNIPTIEEAYNIFFETSFGVSFEEVSQK